MKEALSIPAVKIRMMNASIRCLIFGLLGLLPLIGLPFALVAGWQSGQARSWEKYHWNPAQQIRITGLTCAVIGTMVWTIVDILVIWRIYQYCIGN
jgi:hypothetical protein